jgi:beta-glucosidase
MFDEKTKTWRIAKGKYKVVLAEDAAGKNATSVTVDLPASTLDVRGRPQR